MKIQNDNPGALTSATDALAPATDQTASAGKAQMPSAQADQITLSPEARVLKAIADRAAEPLAVRQDVVDRMRALVDAGTLGDDPARLADAIIDDWLTFP
jgi:flagellar biosynthesis anti-sigma factor FlgM